MLFLWSNRCWQFDLWFLCFSKSTFNIWNFTVHILFKPGLENFEHYFTSMWDECNCAVVWAFFGIAFLWNWSENSPFPVLWPLLSFPNLLAYWVQHFHNIIFQDLKELNWIPSPPLALFVVMLSKAYLTSHSRMSGSRRVITPLWLSWLWRPFLYRSSVYSYHLFLISSASVRFIPVNLSSRIYATRNFCFMKLYLFKLFMHSS